MLSVQMPAFAGKQAGAFEIQLGQQCLVLVELQRSAELRFRAANVLIGGSSDHQPGWAWRLCAAQWIDAEGKFGPADRNIVCRTDLPDLVDAPLPRSPVCVGACNQVQFGPLFEQGELLLDLFGHPQIIGIEERNERSASNLDAVITRRCAAKIRASGVRNAAHKLRIFLGKILGDLAASIAAAVVDQDNLKITATLTKDALDRFGKKPTVVVKWNNDRDAGDRGHRHFSL